MAIGAQKFRIGSSLNACFLLILLMNGLVAGSLYNRRQADNTAKSTVIAPTAPPESSATSESALAISSPVSGESASPSPSDTSAPDRPVLATATTSGTESASSASSASMPSSTASNSTSSDNSTLTEFNDPTGCHVNYTAGVEIDPFCEPDEDSILDVNASYKITWDSSWFDRGSNITILIVDINSTIVGSIDDLELAQEAILNVDSALGYTYFSTTSAMLNGSSNATLTLLANATIHGEQVGYSSSEFILVDKTAKGDNTTASHDSGSSSSSKKLGEKVGIPVGLIFFLIILAVLAFFFLRYRRNSSGFASSKSLGQGANTGSTRNGIGGGGHRRQESFHDEPTSGGVELQNRNRGLTGEDTWEWGRDSVGSPTSPTSGNQFRDELARQKGVGGR